MLQNQRWRASCVERVVPCACGILLVAALPSWALAQEAQSPVVEADTPPSVESAPPSEVLADPETGPPSQGADPPAEDEPPTKAKKSRRDKENFARPWRSQSRGGRSRAVGIGAAGVLGGFLAHELGHVLMNLAYGNVPTFETLTYAGFIPFFRISPDIRCTGDVCIDSNGDVFRGGTSGVYMITSAGFNVQHLVSELILSLDPELRYHRSPFQKGMLFFNLSLSAGYVLSTWFQVKPPIGDIHGMARAAQLNPNWVALMVLIPAGLDLYRYLVPNSKWAPWVSRGAKVTFLGVSFIF